MQHEGQTWNRVLTDATAPDHIVQLYHDQEFLCRAVCQFGGAALANGEGFLLAATCPRSQRTFTISPHHRTLG